MEKNISYHSKMTLMIILMHVRHSCLLLASNTAFDFMQNSFSSMTSTLLSFTSLLACQSLERCISVFDDFHHFCRLLIDLPATCVSYQLKTVRAQLWKDLTILSEVYDEVENAYHRLHLFLIVDMRYLREEQ